MPIASKRRRTAFRLAAAAVFLLMFLFNCLTPYIADDFTFAYAFDTGLRLESLPPADPESRLPLHGVDRARGGEVFCPGLYHDAQDCVQCVQCRRLPGVGAGDLPPCPRQAQRPYDLVLFVLIQASLWEISPAFGQTNLWMCGACNYLWATLGCLAFLVPWRYYLQKPFVSRRRMTVGMGIAGLFAGWLSEKHQRRAAGLPWCCAWPC